MAFLFTLVRKCLLLLPPEGAHRVVVLLLRLYQWLKVKLLRARPPQGVGLVLDSVPHTRFPSRVGLAAGFDKNAEVFAGLAHLGFGFIEVGTVTPEAQPGNPKPRIFRVEPQALVNRLGFNNCGLREFRLNILRYRDSMQGFPLFANLGKGKATPTEDALGDYAEGVKVLFDSVDGFVVNISSPNTPGLRSLQNAEFLSSLARVFTGTLPVWVKLAPDLTDEELTDLLQLVRDERRFSGAVLTNTSRHLAQCAGHKEGGLSGHPLFERSLECVALARKALGPVKTLIAVGGIMNGERAKKMREAGADLMEVYTGFVYRGPELVGEIKAALGEPGRS